MTIYWVDAFEGSKEKGLKHRKLKFTNTNLNTNST